MVTVGDVAGYIESLAPPALAEPWDAVGLQVGRAGSPVERLLVCLDVTDDVLTQAIAGGFRMVVAHHPLFFGSDFRGLTDSTPTGRLGLRAVENGLSIFVAHTNLDKTRGGINDDLAAALDLTDTRVLSARERLLKLVVFAPGEAVERVRAAVGDAGAGRIGLYSHCAFASTGVGSFRPLAGAKPSQGEIGKNNLVDEVRLEVEVAAAAVGGVIKAMEAAHPYEEVAYDLYELEKNDSQVGLGRIGDLSPHMTLAGFIEHCRNSVNRAIRVAGDCDRVARVAVCGGSGASLIEAAADRGADVFVTGDVKYHEAQRAVGRGLVVIDAGHDATEIVGMTALSQRMASDLGIDVRFIKPKEPIWREA